MGGILATATGGMLGDHDKDVAQQQAQGSTNVTQSGSPHGPPAQAPEDAPTQIPPMTKPFSDMVTKTKAYKAASGVTTGDITESVAGLVGGGGHELAPVGTPEIDTYQNAQPQQGYDDPGQPLPQFSQKAMPQLRGFQEYLQEAFNNKV